MTIDAAVPAAQNRATGETLTALRHRLAEPLTIGEREISARLVLAPLSKLGTIAFRELVSEFGGFGLLFSEMSGARAIPHGNGHQKTGFMWQALELPTLVCQIYGDEPAVMAEAARCVEAAGFFGVDVNFGCSVAAICKHNCGAALLRQPKLAVEIIAAIRRAVEIPLFVKYRTGWRDDPDFAVAMARQFEDAGADALTFHPRVAPDRRTRAPKWEYIGRVKDAVSIPVFGNGDVFDASDALRMLDTTGCDGIALGRLAVTQPWIFARWVNGFDPPPTIYQQAALRLIDLLLKHFEPATALRRFYKFASYYAGNFQFGHTFNSMVHRAKCIEDARAAVNAFFRNDPALFARPNINMLR